MKMSNTHMANQTLPVGVVGIHLLRNVLLLLLLLRNGITR